MKIHRTSDGRPYVKLRSGKTRFVKAEYAEGDTYTGPPITASKKGEGSKSGEGSKAKGSKGHAKPMTAEEARRVITDLQGRISVLEGKMKSKGSKSKESSKEKPHYLFA